MFLPLPQDEAARLASLRLHDLRDSASETEYDQIVDLGAELFQVPICLVSIIDWDTQWLKARHGLDVDRTPREISFCTHTILSDRTFVILDAQRDPRFAANPLVRGHPGIRFYAGAPIMDADGVNLGAFCIIGQEPRAEFGEAEERLLRRLAAMVSARIQGRRDLVPTNAVTSFNEATPLATMTTDAGGRISSWNRSAEALFGYGRAEVLRQHWMFILPAADREARGAELTGMLSELAARRRTVDLSVVHKDGTALIVEILLAVWQGASGLMFGAQMRDVTRQRAREAELLHRAEHDDLTGLLKRGAFKARVDRRLLASGRAIVLSLDLDSFEEINDTLGHAVGDELLRLASLRLAECIAGGVLARLDGDEFALLMPEDADLLAAQAAAACLLLAFADAFEVDGHRLYVGPSIGIAFAPDHSADADGLLACSELALFAARKEGGRKYRLFDAAMRNQQDAQRAFTDELRVAFVERQWTLHYQMQNRLSDGKLIGMEGLLRWRHPEHGLLRPSVFMPFLETHGIANDVGDRVIHEACRQLAEWRAAGLDVPQVSVNLFSAQLRSGALARVVRAALAENGLSPADLELEITETIALRHDDDALGPLRALFDGGVGIAFDDFGTGYASLTTIKRFPLTRLKIDRSFVEDIGSASHSTAIVSGIIAMGAILGVDVIAEGIETEEQRAKLIALGCRQGQGFIYGKPASGSDMSRILSVAENGIGGSAAKQA